MVKLGDDEDQSNLDGDVDSFSETQYEIQDVLKVLEVIASQKASYKSEIGARKGLDDAKVGQILHKLEEEGLIEILKPSLGYMDDPRLLDQRHKRQSMFQGIDTFNQPTWFALNSDLDWVLKCKNHSQFDDVDYVDEYGKPVEKDQESFKRSSKLVSDRLEVV